MKLFSLDAAETVLELINQNSLYKGIEYKNAVEFFITFKKQFDLLQTDDARNLHLGYSKETRYGLPFPWLTMIAL